MLNTPKLRILLLLLVLSFNFAYLEWGHGQHAFIFEMFGEIFASGQRILQNLLHPLIAAGLGGLLILLVQACLSRHYPLLTGAALLFLCLVIFVILLAAALNGNMKSLFSVLPFMVLVYLYYHTLWNMIRLKKRSRQNTNGDGGVTLQG